ncbi:MAG: SgcJ/EcaC family oxidoreductase [Acidobacteriia bacterium]|nr:SgcJ/EcaC family oxidoreductase [Terriglobia bacterium]
MKTAVVPLVLLFATLSAGQTKSDQAAIRNILQEEVATWNKGDTDGYSRHFAADGTFTNILGMFFTGHQAFRDRHEEIFTGMFRGTILRQEVVSLKFVRPDVAVVETLTWISGFSKAGPPPGAHTDGNGRLRTRLLQVMAKNGGEWKIVTYHNVDLKPGVSAPDPQ